MKSLEDIIIDIAEWVKKHGPIKQKFCQYDGRLECHCFDFVDGTVKYIECPNLTKAEPQTIEKSRAITMPRGLSHRAAAGWEIVYYEDVLIAFAGWRNPEGKLTLYLPDIQAVTAVLNLVSEGATIGAAVDTFMESREL